MVQPTIRMDEEADSMTWQRLRHLMIFGLAAMAGGSLLAGVQTRAGDVVEITGVHDDMVFAAGGQVRLTLRRPTTSSRWAAISWRARHGPTISPWLAATFRSPM